MKNTKFFFQSDKNDGYICFVPYYEGFIMSYDFAGDQYLISIFSNDDEPYNKNLIDRKYCNKIFNLEMAKKILIKELKRLLKIKYRSLVKDANQILPYL